ncbi:MAG: YraN family protein [Candidatus Azambacteria bacterium]|nr:YraN family protein [Candidatus Azambacteria bacterium]
MTTEKQNIGKLGEDIAVKYLEKHGYKILERNYRKPWGEIDIVAQQSQELVFIEVKTQNQKFEWRPEENITRHKKHQLSRIIITYLKSNKIPEDQNWRIDVLAITLDFKTKNAQIEHIQNIMLN